MNDSNVHVSHHSWVHGSVWSLKDILQNALWAQEVDLGNWRISFAHRRMAAGEFLNGCMKKALV
jgi:hypothetical protein